MITVNFVVISMCGIREDLLEKYIVCDFDIYIMYMWQIT